MDAEKQPHYEENLSSEDSSSTIETTSTLSADDTMEPASTKNSLSPAVYVALWMILSSAVIIYNKWILDDAGFPYPITLTTWHLGFATLATRILARTTSLLDGRKKIKMDARIYFRAIAPIGLFYSFSLICGNLTYLYLSVAFIQMLKAATPVVVLLVSWAFGVLRPDMNKFLIVCIIVAGVFVASIGEVKFNTTGFLYQCGGIVFEATRLVMVQRLLSPTKYKMDPLVSLYYFAPVCTAMNILFAIPLEGGEIHMRLVRRVGLCHFVGNAFVAFALNVASVLLIGKTSSLVLTLSGILKAVLLVLASVMIWGTHVSSLQMMGYGVALVGLCLYQTGSDRIRLFRVQGYSGKGGSIV